MKAMVLTGIREMKMVETDTPAIKNERDVLIKMERVGVCGSDIHYYAEGKIGSQIVQYPFAVGHEGAGTVVSVGQNVSSLKAGDPVAIDPAIPCHHCEQCRSGRPHTCLNNIFLGCPGQTEGNLKEYLLMPESSCIKLTGTLTLDQGALSEPLSIGVYAKKLAGNMKNLHAGILGFGPIGMSVMLPVLTEKPAGVYVTDKINERLKMAGRHGATWIGNPVETDIVGEIIKKVPASLDVVFECCGKQEAIDQAVQLLKPGGKLVLIGIPSEDRISVSIDEMRRKEIVLQNVRRQNDSVHDALDLINRGLVNTDPMVTHRFSFDQTKEAFDLVENYRDGVMKAMIEF